MERQRTDWYKHPQLASKGRTHQHEAAEPWKKNRVILTKLFPKKYEVYLPYYSEQLKQKIVHTTFINSYFHSYMQWIY